MKRNERTDKSGYAHDFRFSGRTNWPREPNYLSDLLGSMRRHGLKDIIDLTVSNPTECGIFYPKTEILKALSDTSLLRYNPDPRGILPARESVSEYYLNKNLVVDPTSVFLTAGTSEAYAFVMRLLCDAGDDLLVPRPSYPLFDYLAKMSDIGLNYYDLFYDREWHIDVESMRKAATKKTKAIIIINPHNPTGMFLKQSEYDEIVRFAEEADLAFIIDEVFSDYPFKPDNRRMIPPAGDAGVLTFTLNGISKMIGLPQLKLGWVVVSGRKSDVCEATARLEIIADTFLSVNTPVQVGLKSLMSAGKIVRENIMMRCVSNYETLRSALKSSHSATPLDTEGGWYAVLQIPSIKTDEEWAIELLKNRGIYIFPGYFFDFQDDCRLVMSLIPDERTFGEAVVNIAEHFSSRGVGLTDLPTK